MMDPETIKQRLASGDKATDLAKEFGVSLRRIYQIRGESKRDPLTPEKIEAIKSAIANGATQRDTAARFRVSRRTISQLVADLDFLPRRQSPGTLPAETIAHILQRFRAGRSTGTIARELNLGVSTVSAVVRRNPNRRLPAGDEIMQAVASEMERRGLTAAGLAKLVTPPPTPEAIVKYMRGEASPSTPVASRILAALGLEIRRAD